MFPQAVIEKIGFYVYFLMDPRDQKVFYVGKGTGNRVFMHQFEELDEPKKNAKLDLIQKIQNAGFKVEHYILRHGLTSEMALAIESSVIDLLEFVKIEDVIELKNINKGHYSLLEGLKSSNEIIEIYNAKDIIISDPVLLITINKYFNRDLKIEELYNVTRYCWHVGSRRSKIKYVFAVYKGLIREVYLVSAWKPVIGPFNNPKDEGRWYFDGKVADDDIREKYVGNSVDKYSGGRNPLKYINC